MCPRASLGVWFTKKNIASRIWSCTFTRLWCLFCRENSYLLIVKLPQLKKNQEDKCDLCILTLQSSAEENFTLLCALRLSLWLLWPLNWHVSFSYISCHGTDLVSKYTQGQIDQIPLLAAANSYRTSALLSYFSVNQNLKGYNWAAWNTLDLSVANLPNFREFAPNAFLTTNYNDDKTEPWAACFSRHFLKGISGPATLKIQSGQNTFWNLPNPLQVMRAILRSTWCSLCCQL